ncbi:DHH family phosphoesterase [Hydrogenimonas sp. SS33]|uniref:DHH family phosphoesterase n=1 Tax=Hydrogenimonas leucolamina TaxID=2954236 RepID=UPI00336C027C
MAVEGARHITVVGHLNPDADALGTGLGLWWIFKEMGKRADALYLSHPLPQTLTFLPGFGKIKRRLHPKTDLIVAVDCGSFDRLGIERPEGVTVLNIDHHRSNEGYGDINLVEPDYACAAEVAFRLAAFAGWEVPRPSAVAFYTALVSDTGFFGFEGVNGRVFDFARRLVTLGADPATVARMLRENQPLSKLRLLPMVLETLTLYLGGRAAGLDLTRAMFRRTGATVADAEDFVNYARSLATVEVGFLIREEEDGSLKVSLRAKERADVSRIAVAFGGGGHRRAAGFTVRGMEREAVLKTLLPMIEEEIAK